MTMNVAARALRDRMVGRVFSAVATPCRPDGSVHAEALSDYATSLAQSRLGGFAVWAHTGRAAYVTDREQRLILATFRDATEKPIIVGVTPSRALPASATLEDKIASMIASACQASDLGADAIMVFPITELEHSDDRIAHTVEAHDRIANTSGLPVIGFYLHPGAGGFPYDVALLDELLKLDSVAGVKMASLFDAVGTQDAIDAVRSRGRLAITGEDRMFGPSLMWGCESALVGIAAAAADLTVDVLDAWMSGDRSAFISSSKVLDDFAKATFYAPIEGYVQRMLWAAEIEGLIPAHAAHDPFGPPPADGERAKVRRFLSSLAPSTP